MKILLLYKNTTYAGYFLTDKRRLAKRFRQTHSNHFWSLSYVETVLKKKKLKFTKACRGSVLDYGRYDLILTVGGDGTFLEAARHVTGETVWGINSDPDWSVGRFCSGTVANFEMLLDKVMAGRARVGRLTRLRVSFSDGNHFMNVLNDVLICHQNPAAMSRYFLTAGRVREEQRSSGVWVATAAGSSGGICSAGGRVMSQNSRNFQYKPRELYHGKNLHYRLTGAVLKARQKLEAASLMREGVIFVDGSHVCLPFSFGSIITITTSTDPLNIILG